MFAQVNLLFVNYYCAARSEFLLRAEPERSEGGLSEEMKNREGVASGSATSSSQHQTPHCKSPECLQVFY